MVERMMHVDNLIIIKSNKYGLLVHLDKDVPYNELLKEIEHKFKDASKFFKNSKMAISFEGRILTKVQELEIIKLISETAQIHIICLIDSNEKNEITYKSIVDQSLEYLLKQDGQFYKGTLGNRQVLESDTSVIIIGDVEAGAKVVAKGNIVVIGSVHGSVHAGASGNENAFIVALSLHPKQLRISEVIARKRISAEAKELSMEPQKATLYKGELYIDSLV